MLDPRACYNSATWRKLRPLILDRDGHRCQIAGPGCTLQATVVDHIVPLLAGGAFFDEDNLRAACVHCNSHRVYRPTTRRRPSRDI